MPLTVVWLNSQLNKPQTKIVRKSDGHGLGVRISPKGKITFTFRYRFDDKQTSVDLGSYPLLSLADARKKALNYRTELEEGRNPANLKDNSSGRFQTFKDYAEAWYIDYFQYKKNASKVMSQIRLHLYPTLGDLILTKTTTYDWMEKLKDLKKSTELADSSFSLQIGRVTQILKYATKHYQLAYNPTQGITGTDFNVRLQNRPRFHTDEELTQIMQILASPRVLPMYRRYTWLVMLTGARVGELFKAKIEHFDFNEKEWFIPAGNSKNEHAFYRPITDVMLGIITDQMKANGDSPYLFPRVRNKNKPYTQLQSRVHERLVQLGVRMFEGYQTDWVMHDFRRSIRSRIKKWVSKDVAELMLGHKLRGIEAVYDKGDYLDEMRVGYNGWCEFLHDLLKKGLNSP